MKVNIKPMSVNMAWRGRRYKTPRYKAFEDECKLKLKPMEIPEGQLALYIEIGVSSKLFDLDNCLKPFIDILQKRYGFNDNRIYAIHAKKVIVKKKEEYIEFSLEEILEDIKNDR